MKWKIGNYPWCVVSDTVVKNTNFPVPPNPSETSEDDESFEYYGGHLICESIGNKDHAKLIAAAPDLLESIKYYFSVLQEAQGENWNKNPDHVLQKMLDAIEKATK